jgi:hypothetical protein
MPEHEGVTEILVLILVWGGRLVDDWVGGIVCGPGDTMVKTVGDGLGLLILLNVFPTRQGLRNRVLWRESESVIFPLSL